MRTHNSTTALSLGHGHVGDCSLLVEHSETKVDRDGLDTNVAGQRFQTTQMARVTALHGFKRRPWETIPKRRERHRPQIHTHTENNRALARALDK